MKRLIAVILTLCILLSVVPGSIVSYSYDNGGRFTDVKNTHWFYNAVTYVYEKGLMSGMSTEKFGPNVITTRAMIVTVLHRMEGKPIVKAKAPFKDVKKGSYYEDAVNWASVNGIVYGMDAITFGPNVTLTREQTAAILYRYAEYKGYNADDSKSIENYDDHKKVAEWSRRSMEWSVGIGIISGTGNNMLSPRGNATRAQIATLLMQFENLVVIDSENQLHVSFMLNDGSDSVYYMDTTHKNNKISEPVPPVRATYKFTGWYVDPDNTVKYRFTSSVHENTILYAGWEADAADDVYEIPKTDTVYSISELIYEDDKIYTTVNAPSACYLAIEILSEDKSEVLWDYTCELVGRCEMTRNSIFVNEELPKYFILRAVLCDYNYYPFTDWYETIYYTSAYEEFDSRTTDDYDSELVINFDDDKKDNYGVLDEKVKCIDISRSDLGLTVVENVTYSPDTSNESGFSFITDQIYIFESPDSKINSLNIGDCVYLKNDNGTEYLFKVGNIEKDEYGAVIISPADDVELTDFYNTLKVEMSYDIEDGTSAGSPAVYSVDSIVTDWNTIAKEDFSVALGAADLSGSFSAIGTATMVFIYDEKAFGKDFLFYSLISDLDITIDAKLEVKAEKQDLTSGMEEFTTITIPTPVPGLGVYLTPTIPVEVEANVGLYLDAKYNIISGIIFDSRNGVHLVKDQDGFAKLDAGGSAFIKAGPKIAIGICFLKNVIKAELNIWGGLSLQCEVWNTIIDTEALEYHCCDLCVSGYCEIFLELGALIEVCVIKDILEFKPYEGTFIAVSVPIKFDEDEPGYFYISVINSPDSIFEGKLSFGEGHCPNYKYRAIVTVVDKNGEICENADIIIENKKTGDKFGVKASDLISLYDGEYIFTVELDDSVITQNVTVNGSYQYINIVWKPNLDFHYESDIYIGKYYAEPFYTAFDRRCDMLSLGIVTMSDKYGNTCILDHDGNELADLGRLDGSPGYDYCYACQGITDHNRLLDHFDYSNKGEPFAHGGENQSYIYDADTGKVYIYRMGQHIETNKNIEYAVVELAEAVYDSDYYGGKYYEPCRKYGIVIDSKLVVPCEYDAGMDYDNNGIAALRKDGLWGYFNSEGKQILDNKYYGLTPIGIVYPDVLFPLQSSYGYICLFDGEKWGYSDLDGNIVIDFMFDDAVPVYKDKAWVKYMGQWSVINVEPKYEPLTKAKLMKIFDVLCWEDEDKVISVEEVNSNIKMIYNTEVKCYKVMMSYYNEPQYYYLTLDGDILYI